MARARFLNRCRCSRQTKIECEDWQRPRRRNTCSLCRRWWRTSALRERSSRRGWPSRHCRCPAPASAAHTCRARPAGSARPACRPSTTCPTSPGRCCRSRSRRRRAPGRRRRRPRQWGCHRLPLVHRRDPRCRPLRLNRRTRLYRPCRSTCRRLPLGHRGTRSFRPNPRRRSSRPSPRRRSSRPSPQRRSSRLLLPTRTPPPYRLRHPRRRSTPLRRRSRLCPLCRRGSMRWANRRLVTMTRPTRTRVIAPSERHPLRSLVHLPGRELAIC